MFFNFTEEEFKKMHEIHDFYAQRLNDIYIKLKALEETPDTDKKKTLLLADLNNTYEQQARATDAEIDKAQRRTFKPIAEKGIENILANAKEQAPQLLESTYSTNFSHNIDEKEKEIYEGGEIGTIKGKKFLFFPEYATNYLNEELYLHIEALRDDPDASEKLKTIIEQCIKESPYVLKTEGHEQSPLKQAEMLGAVTTLKGRLTTISNKNYQFALSSYKNKYAYMINSGSDMLKTIKDMTEENDEGQLAVTDENEKQLKKDAKQKPVDSLLVRAFYSAALASQESEEQSESKNSPYNMYVAVYLPKFCRELNIRLSQLREDIAQELNFDFSGSDSPQVDVVEDKHTNDFWERLAELKGYIGVLKENGYVEFMNIVRYDKDTQIIYLDFPYFRFLNDEIRKDTDRIVTSKRDKTKVLYEKKTDNKLFDSSIAGCRNKAGAEIAFYLVNGVIQRGGDPDSKLKQNLKKKYPIEDAEKITYRVSCEKIINTITAFKYRLENMKSNATNASAAEKSILTQQNKALKDAFTAAYNLIRTKSDFYKYYKNAKITEVIPTMRQLKNTEIEITHFGVNSNYKKP